MSIVLAITIGFNQTWLYLVLFQLITHFLIDVWKGRMNGFLKKDGFDCVKIQLTNDKDIIVSEDKMSFITITDWKEHINKNNGSSL